MCVHVGGDGLSSLTMYVLWLPKGWIWDLGKNDVRGNLARNEIGKIFLFLPKPQFAKTRQMGCILMMAFTGLGSVR